MRILFFHPSTSQYIKAPSVPLGALSVATFMKDNGHTVKISDRCIRKENIKKLVKEFQPDIVGLSIMSARGIKDAQFISQTIKKMNLPVIWCGHYPTFIYDDALNSGLVDVVVLGEGEFTFLELVNNISRKLFPDKLDEIPGLAYRREGKIVVTKTREFADPADLPLIDYSLVDVPRYYQTWYGCKKMLYLYGSKGCPFACTFCYNAAYNRSQFRKRPDEVLFKEFDYLVNEQGMDGIYFTDDVFCPKKEDLQKFCAMMKQKNYKMTWGCQARTGQFSRADFELMYDAGCRWIFYGVETGSASMQSKVGKNLDLDKMEDTFKAAKETGLITISSLIIGFPDETVEQLRETVALAKRIKADLYPCNMYTPNIEQKLCQDLIRQGRFRPPKTLEEHAKLNPTVDCYAAFSNVPYRDLMVIRSYFHWLSFTKKGTNKSAKPFEFAAKALNDAYINIFRFGLVSFVSAGLYSLKTFLSVVWNVYAHPGIRKKYGLYRF
ncbi:MAG TPA: radical SAM protein [Clostridiales bacterium]|nr:radical SAM protein [Clostridiales bacterium]